MIKLVVADMDGTSLNSKEILSQENIESIIKVIDSGREFIFASGRPVFGMKGIIKKSGLENIIKYFISYNGGVVYDVKNDKNIYVKSMDFNIIKEIYHLVVNSNLEVCFCLHEDNNIYISEENDEIDVEVKSNNQTKINIKDINDYSKTEFMKILLVGKNENLNKMVSILKQSYIYGDIKTMFSLDNLLEILPIDSDKSVALKWFSEYLNIPLENVLAVGDAENDIEMIKEVGTGVAMNNAYEHVKEVADYITTKTNNESGLSEVIENLLK